jgi:hypothetical protein
VTLRYKYTVDDVVLESFSSAKKRYREELLRIFSTLASDPFTRADWIQKDSAGRDCHVKRFGPWVVTYWPEHIGSLLHIIDVERLS